METAKTKEFYLLAPVILRTKARTIEKDQTINPAPSEQRNKVPTNVKEYVPLDSVTNKDATPLKALVKLLINAVTTSPIAPKIAVTN